MTASITDMRPPYPCIPTPTPKEIIVDEKPKLAIRVSSADAVIPRTMLQGKRQPGTLCKDGEVIDWYWQGFTTIGEDRFMYFEPLDLLSSTTLFSLSPAQALGYVLDLARAMEARGIVRPLSLDAVYLVRTGGILILSDEIQTLQQSQKHDDIRAAWYDDWTHPGLTGVTGVIFYLTGLLYAVLTGRPPLADQGTREDSRRPIPMNLLVSGVDAETASWIDTCLRSTGKRRPADMGSWIAHMEQLVVTDHTEPTPEADIQRTRQLESYLQSQRRRASRNVFLRRRGSLAAVIAVITIAILAIAGSYIGRALEPPLTVGLTQEEVVESYFDAIGRLDSELLSETLEKGVKSPLQQTVIYLYVTTKTRQAYEQNDGLISASEWVAQGTPDLPPSTIVFGITDLELRRVDDDTIEASYRLWLPGTGTEETPSETVPEDSYKIPIITDRIVEQFDLVKGPRDFAYYLISDIREISRER